MSAAHHPVQHLVAQVRALQRGKLRVPDLLEAVLERTAAVAPGLKCYITLADAGALRQEALALQREADAGRRRGPLHGVPIGIKDIIETGGLRTTGGSAALDDWTPAQDATAVRRLREAGALIIGKHNTHEFAFGITTDNERFGQCLNPWSSGHVPGGSSGGSGAAVGAGLCIAALGTDTGSSIRRPAAYCGAVGLKPRYGRVSRHGAMLVSWSCDHVGPLAASVFDAVAMLDAIAGPDPADPSTRQETWAPLAPTLQDAHGLRTAAVPRRWIESCCEPGVLARFDEACRIAEQAGLRLVDVEPPFGDAVAQALRTISTAEARVAHEQRFAERGNRYSDELKMLVRLGGYIPAHVYIKAQQLRERFRAWMTQCFDSADLLLTPTIPIVAPRIKPRAAAGAASGSATAGGKPTNAPPAPPADSPALMQDVSGLFCTFGSLGGLESISIPMGLSEGLPCGLMLTGPGKHERALLRLAAALEQHLPPLPACPL